MQVSWNELVITCILILAFLYTLLFYEHAVAIDTARKDEHKTPQDPLSKLDRFYRYGSRVFTIKSTQVCPLGHHTPIILNVTNQVKAPVRLVEQTCATAITLLRERNTIHRAFLTFTGCGQVRLDNDDRLTAVSWILQSDTNSIWTGSTSYTGDSIITNYKSADTVRRFVFSDEVTPIH